MIRTSGGVLAPHFFDLEEHFEVVVESDALDFFLFEDNAGPSEETPALDNVAVDYLPVHHLWRGL